MKYRFISIFKHPSSISLLAMIFCGLMLAAASAGTNYNSAKSGDWSNPATWIPNGVPGNGDAVVIQHDVTASGTVTIGQSLAGVTALALSRGSLTIPDGAVLILRGNVIQSVGTMTYGKGAGKILFDSTQTTPSSTAYTWLIGNGYNTNPALIPVVQLTGTATARFRVESVLGGGNGRFTDGGNYGAGAVQASYTDFVRLGDASHLALSPNFANRA